ncbi:hypothetical protein F4779DRAFT_67848 [Xylariaceae sp. FL0662B]|nr:hypothetical protein F4779DRAFT_67848 [Xylariaceae sp. FL0662B]
MTLPLLLLLLLPHFLIHHSRQLVSILCLISLVSGMTSVTVRIRLIYRDSVSTSCALLCLCHLHITSVAVWRLSIPRNWTIAASTRLLLRRSGGHVEFQEMLLNNCYRWVLGCMVVAELVSFQCVDVEIE